MKRAANEYAQQPAGKRPATGPRPGAQAPAGGKLTTQDALSYLREVSHALCAMKYLPLHSLPPLICCALGSSSPLLVLQCTCHGCVGTALGGIALGKLCER